MLSEGSKRGIVEFKKEISEVVQKPEFNHSSSKNDKDSNDESRIIADEKRDSNFDVDENNDSDDDDDDMHPEGNSPRKRAAALLLLMLRSSTNISTHKIKTINLIHKILCILTLLSFWRKQIYLVNPKKKYF